MSPYTLQTIADQFQAEADLAEFPELDVAMLDNVAGKKQNDTGLNHLKQKAAQGVHPYQAIVNLVEETRKKKAELAAREAETAQYANQAKIIDSAVGQMIGPTDQELRQRGLYAVQNVTDPLLKAIGNKGFMGAVGEPTTPGEAAFASVYRDMPYTAPGMIASPSESVMPGGMAKPASPANPTDLLTRYSELSDQQANLQRETASDEAYNRAMAAVRAALEKSPTAPALQKPQLTKEDQALVALAGIFGGFQNMPRALQGALAGAQQRAEIENQQLQNKFQQEQTVYQRQIQGLQNVAETEAERRTQEQKTLDKNYQMRSTQISNELSKIPYQFAMLGQDQKRIDQKQEEIGIKKEAAAAKAANIRQQVTKKEQVQLLKNEQDAWNSMIRIMQNKAGIDEKDVVNMTNQRIRAIRRLTAAGLSVPQDYFYIPPVGMHPSMAMNQANRVFGAGVDLAIDAATGKFPVIPLDPQVEEKVKSLQTRINTLSQEELKLNEKRTAFMKKDFKEAAEKFNRDEIDEEEFNKVKAARVDIERRLNSVRKQIQDYKKQLTGIGEQAVKQTDQALYGPVGKNNVVSPTGAKILFG
jgi:hypothetical protein